MKSLAKIFRNCLRDANRLYYPTIVAFIVLMALSLHSLAQNETIQKRVPNLKRQKVEKARTPVDILITPTTDTVILQGALLVPGTGITVTSITFTGADSAAGTYTLGPLSIDDGIILATGNVLNALPPDESPSTSTNFGFPGDPLCDSLAGFPTFDAARLDITFDADDSTNGISFQFIFGSEEYPEFVGSQFNDVYGAFLNGAQIAFDDMGNPITINGPFFMSGSVVIPPTNGLEYDGSTGLLQTQAPVLPGSSNTLTFVICDASDEVYDSGVLLASLQGLPDTTITGTNFPPELFCPDSLMVFAGEELTFNVTAQDTTESGNVTLSVSGLPAGASMDPTLPAFENPVTSMFSWIPDISQVGEHIVTFSVIDSNQLVVSCDVVITVKESPSTDSLCVTFDNLTVGTQFGGCAGNMPNDLIFTENNIAVFVQEFQTSVGPFFNCAEVFMSGFGSGNYMGINNINLEFDFTGLAGSVNSVALEYFDLGGHENISVNGAPIFVGELTSAPTSWPGGVILNFVPGGLILNGNVNTLIIGGQEFGLDNICVSTGPDSLICDITPGSSFNIFVGEFLTFDVTATGGIDPLTLELFPDDELPMGATMMPPIDPPLVGPGPLSSTFEWTPVAGQEGIYIFGYMITDSLGNQTFCKVDITVNQDTIPPLCEVTNIDPGPPFTIEVTVQDPQSGVAAINVVFSNNANVTIPPFTPGTTDPIIVTAEKIDQTQSATVVLEVVDVAGNTTLCDPVTQRISAVVPQGFALRQNFPNPFNPSTDIHFDIPANNYGAVDVAIKVYDITGREVITLVNKPMEPGRYSVQWDAKNSHGQTVAGGIYVYRMVAGDFVATRKMLLLK